MTTLALDTATAACSVALLRDDGELFEHRPPAMRLYTKPAHTKELLPAILELVSRADIQLAEVDRVVVGIGPGAFTGLRIGVATARAIATANDTGLIAVSSLAALGDGVATPMVDARRAEIYFRVGDVDQLASPEQAIERAAAAGLPAVGDGALLLRHDLSAAGVEVPGDDDPVHVVSAAALIELASKLAPVAPVEIEPNYIRPPDAKVSSRESWMVGGRS